MYQLFKNQSADGNGDAFELLTAPGAPSKFLELGFMATGTFGGGTCKLQVGPTETGPFSDPTDVNATADELMNVNLRPRTWVRAVLTGATSPDLNAILY